MLAVRVTGSEDALHAVRACPGCAAIVLPNVTLDHDAVRLAGRDAGVGVLVLRPGVSWAHLVGALHSLLDDRAMVETPVVGSLIADPEGDLFAVADSVASLVGAPVTIEDPRARVIAFSTHQGQVDPARVESIMQRQVPAQYLDRMRRHGILRQLAESDRPIFVRGRQPDIQPRAAMAIRAGREMLGSIWVVVERPLSPQHDDVLVQAAAVVAVQLLRRRQSSDYERRIHTDALRRLLAGDLQAAAGATWLTRPGRCLAVVAARLAGTGGERQDLAWERHALADHLRTHLMATAPESMAALVDQTVYAIVSQPADRSPLRSPLGGFLTQFATGFTRDGRHPAVHIGVGTMAERVRDLPESRDLADLVLRVLMERSPEQNAVGSLDDVGAAALVLYGRERVRRTAALGGTAVLRVREFDAEHQTYLAETLFAWLCAHGNSDRAAVELHVHPNTVRYRIRQLRELSLIDLEDPAERFAAYLHLQP